MTKLILKAPLDGWSTALEDVPDAAFAQRMLGDGLAIDPTSSTLHSPCDGEVVAIAAASHALTVRAATGVEILLHVGLDTVKLGGQGFEALVRQGARVTTGEPLLRFDLDALARLAPSVLTPLVVMEGAGIAVVSRRVNCAVRVGDVILEIEAQGARVEPLGVGAGEEITRQLVVIFEHGIHARPAAQLANSLKGFSAEVVVLVRGKKANARSGVALMGLGIQRGEEITVTAVGSDALAAVAALEAALIGAQESRTARPVPRIEVRSARPADDNNRDVNDRRIIHAVIASRGLAVGRAAHLARPEPQVAEAGAGIPREAAELTRSRAAVKARMESLAAAASGATREVLDAHLAFIDDPALVEAAEGWIARGKSAGYAWRQAINESVAQLRGIGDPRVRERIDDLNDLSTQVLLALAGQSASYELPEHAIVLANELLPSQFVSIASESIAGVCVAGGGPTSHVAILAAAMGMPMLVAAGPSILAIPEGAELVLDAEAGTLLTDPDISEVSAAQATLERKRALRTSELALAQEECRTADGLRIEMFANVGSLAEASAAVRQGAEGCGLLRTEFLFLDRETPPDDAYQIEQYQAIADVLSGATLVIRTLDAGGDKPIRYLPLPHEDNPALGLRGVRTSLWRPDLLRTQLRAVLSVDPPEQCRVMLPMITSAAEIRAVRGLLDEVSLELGREVRMPLGIMVETPAAALIADSLAADADFLSIGSNDLTQYTLAMDRGHPQLAVQLDGLHPAVLRLIAATAEGARGCNRRVSVCGALASDPFAVPILIGLGVLGLSAVPSMIPQLKALIRRLSTETCRTLARRALEQESAAAVRALSAQVIG